MNGHCRSLAAEPLDSGWDVAANHYRSRTAGYRIASRLIVTRPVILSSIVRPIVNLGGVIEEPMATADLLEAWREAIRAAELADRLAKIALDAVERTARNAAESEEIAEMAERAAEAALHAAQTARAAAHRASAVATAARTQEMPDASRDALAAQEAATRAGEQYHKAEQDALNRQRSR
jgi:hypothetical protein